MPSSYVIKLFSISGKVKKHILKSDGAMRKFRYFLFVSLAVLVLAGYHFLSFKSSTPSKSKDAARNSETQMKDSWFPKTNQNSGDLILTKMKFKKQNDLDPNTKIILLYTGLFFKPWWWGIREDNLNRYTYEKKCFIKNCYFTYAKENFLISDAVILHGVDLNKPNYLKKLSKMRPSKQRWILFMHESPQYTQDLEEYNGIFNWTMTYMKKSDIFVPYFSFNKLRSELKKPKFGTNFADGKTGKVAWVISHCGLIRDSYALELEKYIDVTVYGNCAVKYKRNMGRCSDWGKECENELKAYKFYLAFENCFCKDYLTEKYWEKGLRYGLVPVVMGAMDVDSHAIPGSYIDVNDFESIEKLAKHLSYLDGNATAYNEYFKWRYQYEITHGVDTFCEVCRAVHKEAKSEHVYDNLDEFWSTKKNCHPYRWKIDGVKKQISKSKFKFNHR